VKEIFVEDAVEAARAAGAANFHVVEPSTSETKTRAYVVRALSAGHVDVVKVIKLLNVFGVDISEGVRAAKPGAIMRGTDVVWLQVYRKSLNRDV